MKENYRQHITLGIVRWFNPPSIIRSKFQEEWKLRLASEFVAVATLTIKNINVKLVCGNLLKWDIHMRFNSSQHSMQLHFGKHGYTIGRFSTSRKLSKFEDELEGTSFGQSVFVFVHVIYMVFSLDIPEEDLLKTIEMHLCLFSKLYC